jgi:hypothetical protein
MSSTKVEFITVELAEKQPDHPSYGRGSKLGYTLNSQAGGATLVLRRGTLYQFIVVAPAHPFYLTRSKTGGPQDGDEPLLSPNATPITGSGRAWLDLRANHADSLVPVDLQLVAQTELYYQCRNHPYMGGRVRIVSTI